MECPESSCTLTICCARISAELQPDKAKHYCKGWRLPLKGISVTRTSAHCEESWHGFYQDITDRRREVAEVVPFSFMVQAFVTFACIGRAEGRFMSLSKIGRASCRDR